MMMPDMLASLLASLREDATGAQERYMLIKYVCESSGAQLALLYILNTTTQTLDLLDLYGQLPEVGEMEQAQMRLGERLRLYAISSISGSQGVLVLCFRTGDEAAVDEQRERDLQLCLSLLPAYLIDVGTSAAEPIGIPLAGVQPVPDVERVDNLQEAIERERERIARDIHDGAAQRSASVLPRLAYITRLLEREKGETTEVGERGRQAVQRELGRACEVLEEGLDELRHSISALLPPQLEHQSFDAALRVLLDDLAFNEPGVEVVYDGDVPAPVPPALEIHIFRFVQEALNNARKHARATRVSVSIRLLTGLLLVEVEDNGVGFDPRRAVRTGVGAGIATGVRDGTETGETSLHFGLREMRERIAQAGGRWEVRSTPGTGTLLKAVFPVSKSAIVLTSREREVLRLLVEGLTNRAIAEKLSVSMETVKSHVHHIMQKMGVKDRTQAAVIATKLRLL